MEYILAVSGLHFFQAEFTGFLLFARGEDIFNDFSEGFSVGRAPSNIGPNGVRALPLAEGRNVGGHSFFF